MLPLDKLLAEIKRRPVWQLIGLYLGASWVVLQVVDVLVQNMDLPSTVFPLALFLLVVGLFVVSITALLQKRTGLSGLPGGRWSARVFTWGNVMVGGVVAFAVWGVVSAGLLLLHSDPKPTPGHDPARTLAVLPFTFQGNTDYAYLGEGLVDLLSTKLDGAGELRAVDPRAILSLPGADASVVLGPRQGRHLAEEFGAGLFILGNIVQVGHRLTISAALYDLASGQDPLAEASETGPTDDVFESVDRLAAQLLSGLATGPAARVQRVATVSTASLPALRAYLEGERAYRMGRYRDAVSAFQEAVRIDETYAVAYYRLSVVAEFSTLSDLAQESAELAFRNADRLSERDRRLLEAFLAWRQGAHAEAERLYRGLVRSYPDEVEAWFELGEVLAHGNPLHGRPFTEAWEPFSTALRLDPRNTAAMYHLARIASVTERWEELDSLAARHNRLNPGGDRELEVLALQAFSRPQPEAQAEVLARLRAATDLGVALAGWDVATWTEDAKGARDVLTVLTDVSRPTEVRTLGHAWLAQIELARGRVDASRAHLAEMEALDSVAALEYRAVLAANPLMDPSPDELRALLSRLEALDAGAVPPSDNPSIVYNVHDRVHPLLREYLLGVIHAHMGDSTRAFEHAARTADVVVGPAEGSMAGDLAASIRAQWHWREGRDADALAELDAIRREIWYIGTLSSTFYGQALERFLRAELLYRTGQLERAARWFASLSQIAPYELAFRALAFERLGQIHDELGDTAAAEGFYRKLVSLWADSDARFRPRLEAARSRIDRPGGS